MGQMGVHRLKRINGGLVTCERNGILRFQPMRLIDFPLGSRNLRRDQEFGDSSRPRPIQEPGVVAFDSSRSAAMRLCSVRRLISSISAARLRLPCT